MRGSRSAAIAGGFGGLRCRELVQQVDDCIRGGPAHRNDDRMLVLGRFLQRFELAVQQRGWHIAMLALADPRGDQLLVTPQINQRDTATVAYGDPAIGALQVGAGDDAWLACGQTRIDPLPYGLEPGLAVLVV